MRESERERECERERKSESERQMYKWTGIKLYFVTAVQLHSLK